MQYDVNTIVGVSSSLNTMNLIVAENLYKMTEANNITPIKRNKKPNIIKLKLILIFLFYLGWYQKVDYILLKYFF